MKTLVINANLAMTENQNVVYENKKKQVMMQERQKDWFKYKF